MVVEGSKEVEGDKDCLVLKEEEEDKEDKETEPG